jgi:hypothetical protein
MGLDQTGTSETARFISPPEYSQVGDRNPFESPKKAAKKGWNLNLILCCLCAATASLQFGYNISSLNSPSTLIKDFIGNNTFLFKRYTVGKAQFDMYESWINGNRTKLVDGRYQVESNMARVAECSFSFGDEICEADVARIMEASKVKKAELRQKFNWTGE